MQIRRIIELALAAMVVAGTASATQAAPASGFVSILAPRALAFWLPPVESAPVSAAEVVREIDDPHTGDRWLLRHDPNRPAGPGLLTLIAAGHVNPSEPKSAGPAAATTLAPIIRAGDRVIVEKKTAVVEARLEAVALGPAYPGSPFNVRLSIGGRVIRAVAVGPGRAVFAEETSR